MGHSSAPGAVPNYGHRRRVNLVRGYHPSSPPAKRAPAPIGNADPHRHHAANPDLPVLHRKEAFLSPDDPRRPKFARLAAYEERAGLLDDTATIGTRAGWSERLCERGYTLRGHRLVRCRLRMD
jgi:hypothetical protein